jgi:dTDP-4-amino-4,6-dideoxygalactose transaminase
MKWKIPLAKTEFGLAEKIAVWKVLGSKWATMGPQAEAFEAEFAAKAGVPHALTVSSCTAALHLAVLALGIGPGDEVIVPALTFVASANAVRYAGATPVFADVRSRTDWTLSPDAVKAAYTPRTKAVMVMHYGGWPCRMQELMDFCREKKIRLIEDCAHAPDTRYLLDGVLTHAGAGGDIGAFSFFGNKNLTTGEGGMITVKDPGLAEKIRLLRSHGMTTLSFDRFKGHADSYDVIGLGYNFRIDDMRSAIGRIQLRKLPRLQKIRSALVREYQKQLGKISGVVVPFLDVDLKLSSCHLFTLLVPGRSGAVRTALREAGIQTSRHYRYIPEFSAYKAPFESVLGPSEDLLTLPLWHKLSISDVRYICSIVKKALV